MKTRVEAGEEEEEGRGGGGEQEFTLSKRIPINTLPLSN